MKIRNVTSLIGILFGIVYTVYGVYGAYRSSEIVQSGGMKIFEGLVFAAFILPFSAVIGLGLGLLLEGLVRAFQKKESKPTTPADPDAEA